MFCCKLLLVRVSVLPSKVSAEWLSLVLHKHIFNEDEKKEFPNVLIMVKHIHTVRHIHEVHVTLVP